MKIYRPQWRVQTFRKGGGVIQTRIEGGAGQKKIFFRRFGPQFGAKIRKGRAPWAPSLDPPQAPCKVIKDTLDSGFHALRWIPDSRNIGFQIICQWNLDSRFLSLPWLIPDSLKWKKDSKAYDSGIAQAEVIGFLFFSKDYLSCALLYHFVLIVCQLLHPFIFFFWMRELMPYNYCYIFHPYPLVPSPDLKRYRS